MRRVYDLENLREDIRLLFVGPAAADNLDKPAGVGLEDRELVFEPRIELGVREPPKRVYPLTKSMKSRFTG